jgi:hypothetical protein
VERSDTTRCPETRQGLQTKCLEGVGDVVGLGGEVIVVGVGE